ncbi:hypothetical protein SAMN05880501_10868 [Ureibacillus xyleni]|uniref:Uncharacterized protein n=1 Tax=Ureibacillus xyleni TaxID=614648 RepID=A0A285T2G4_9BACL|nr:hypothetical protein [Ureibacillus xyleni]SOC15298.1 hypothetical protein SAMN05880501_10868 [Ureibacillus xyleni]
MAGRRNKIIVEVVERLGNEVNPVDNVKWINGSYKEDNRIFDSEFEVKKWADALYPDFVAYLGNKNNVGYATPDEKVIKYLASLLPQWAVYNNLQIGVCTGKTKINGQIIYKIWTVKL